MDAMKYISGFELEPGDLVVINQDAQGGDRQTCFERTWVVIEFVHEPERDPERSFKARNLRSGETYTHRSDSVDISGTLILDFALGLTGVPFSFARRHNEYFDLFRILDATLQSPTLKYALFIERK